MLKVRSLLLRFSLRRRLFGHGVTKTDFKIVSLKVLRRKIENLL